MTSLADRVRAGTFKAAKHADLLASEPDLEWPAFAHLQRLYRRGRDEKERREAAAEFERLVKEAQEEAQRDTGEVSPDAFTADHFAEWASGLVLDSGETWELETFQRNFAADLFTGTPECWLVVPEGNGKTTLVAGLALYHCEFTPGAWVPVAASARDQAEILFRQAEGFVRRTPRLRSTFRAYEGYRRIVGRRNQSRLQVLASDDRTGDGVIPTLAICDELHRHKDLSLYRTWSGKLDKRAAQLVAISTAGEPGSEFETTREQIRTLTQDVTRDGCFVRAVSADVLLHEWAVPESEDVESMAIVKEANPFSGITVEKLRRKREKPTMTLGHWRRFVCNLPTRSELAAIQETEWYASLAGDEIPEGERIWAGLDVAWKWDTTALVPLWWRDEEFRLLGTPSILVPPRDGTSLDPALVEAAIFDLHARNQIDTLVMDTSKAEQLASWIESELGCRVVDRQQTNTLACTDYARFMEALRSGWLKHVGDPGLTAHALNAIARILPGGDARFDRPAQNRRSPDQDRRVIDALVAAAMVHSTRVAVGDLEELVIH